MFQQCLELPSQSRHSICFPLLCTHFMSCTHELCPEEVKTHTHTHVHIYCNTNIIMMTVIFSCDLCPFTLPPPQRHHIGDRSLSLCNMFLDEMAKQARNLITDICTEQCTLSDQVRDTQAKAASVKEWPVVEVHHCSHVCKVNIRPQPWVNSLNSPVQNDQTQWSEWGQQQCTVWAHKSLLWFSILDDSLVQWEVEFKVAQCLPGFHTKWLAWLSNSTAHQLSIFYLVCFIHKNTKV